MSGSAKVNISSLSSGSADLISLLQTNFGISRADQILSNLGLGTSGSAGPGRGSTGGPPGGRAPAARQRDGGSQLHQPLGVL